MATYGFGDSASTYVAVRILGLREGNPFVARLLESSGFEGLVAAKVAALCVLYGLYAASSLFATDRQRLFVPAFLSLLGAALVVVNLWVVFHAYMG